MNRLDLTQAALQTLQPAILDSAANVQHDEARSLRGRILGVLIRKVRFEAKRSPVECAEFLGIEPQLIEAWEFGESIPSWPQVELLSLFLNGRTSDSGYSAIAEEQTARIEYLLLRQRLIGAQLRAVRETIGWSIEELSKRSGFEAGQINRFELGEEKVPVCDLAALAQSLKTDLSFFAAIPPAPPNSLPRQENPELLVKTHTDLRQFAAQNENSAFIKLAMAFKHIAPDDLHRIADALFAIISAKADANGRSGSRS